MKRILIAGIGNIFLGDDAFGVEAARRLAERAWPDGVEVCDYGVRCLDLAYALGEGWEGAILVDAVGRGGAAGTLYRIELLARAPARLPGPAVAAPGRLRRASRLCAGRLGGPAAPSRRGAASLMGCWGRAAFSSRGRRRATGASAPAELRPPRDPRRVAGAPVRSLSRRFSPLAKRRDPREPSAAAAALALDGHGMGVAEVLELAARMASGAPDRLRRLWLVGCEPQSFEVESGGLSPAVAAALPGAVAMVEALVEELLASQGMEATTA